MIRRALSRSVYTHTFAGVIRYALVFAMPRMDRLNV